MYAGAKDLGHVRAVAERKRQDAGRHRVDDEAELRQAEINQVNLDEQRKAAEEGRVEAGDGVGETIAGKLGDRAGDRDDRSDDDGNRRDVERGDNALADQERQLLGCMFGPERRRAWC